jgi:hypothetical protein
MENLHGVLHGMKWTMFHGPTKFASSPPDRDGSNTKLKDRDTLNLTTLDLL